MLEKLLSQARVLLPELVNDNVFLILRPYRVEDGETFDKSRLPRRIRAGIAGRFAHMMTVISSMIAQ